MDVASVIGGLAAIASTTSFAPQAWKTIRSRKVTGLSSTMYALTVVAFALWLTYGILKRDIAIIAANGICLALSAFILLMILLPSRDRNQLADTLEPGRSGTSGR